MCDEAVTATELVELGKIEPLSRELIIELVIGSKEVLDASYLIEEYPSDNFVDVVLLLTDVEFTISTNFVVFMVSELVVTATGVVMEPMIVLVPGFDMVVDVYSIEVYPVDVTTDVLVEVLIGAVEIEMELGILLVMGSKTVEDTPY